jgi:hypothetical protein
MCFYAAWMLILHIFVALSACDEGFRGRNCDIGSSQWCVGGGGSFVLVVASLAGAEKDFSFFIFLWFNTI